MKSWLRQEWLSNAIGNIAQAAQILEETLEYVKERTAFGPPIGSFEYNKFLLDELVTRRSRSPTATSTTRCSRARHPENIDC